MNPRLPDGPPPPGPGAACAPPPWPPCACPARAAAIGQPAPPLSLPGATAWWTWRPTRARSSTSTSGPRGAHPASCRSRGSTRCRPATAHAGCRWWPSTSTASGPIGRRLFGPGAGAHCAGLRPAGDSARRYAVQGMPSSVLMAADGSVLQQHAGFRDDDKRRARSRHRGGAGACDAAIARAAMKKGPEGPLQRDRRQQQLT
jgi:hypothetical protein